MADKVKKGTLIAQRGGLIEDRKESAEADIIAIIELAVKNSDLYFDHFQRNLALQTALRSMADSARVQFIAPRANERYTDSQGVTRTVRALKCRGLRYVGSGAGGAGSLICEPIIEEIQI